jgi:RNA polymerase sigma-70 factor (ECF subfamily)
MTDSELEFQHIYSAFRPKIHRYLARLTGADEADDLTQEVFIKVSRGLKGFRGESKLSSWIYRIATNAALDHLRRPSQMATEMSSIDTEREEEPYDYGESLFYRSTAYPEGNERAFEML